MNLPHLTAARANDLISRFAGLRVVVVGDLMIDRFIVGRVSRISPEAPVPVVHFESEHSRLGGAANVAHNVAALGARVMLVGVTGADQAAARFRHLMEASGLSSEGLVEDRARPTVEKVRVVTERKQQVARIDYEDDADATSEIEEQLIDRIARCGRGAKALLVSDYLKGTITRGIMAALLRTRSAGAPLIVDPKIPHLDCYAGASLVTPNHHEAETATHLRIRTDDEARLAGVEFRKRARCEAALITRGDQGMWLSSPDAEGSIPAVTREVSDVTGAGDTVVATLAVASAAGATLLEAAMLANHAAGAVVGKFGPATVTPTELIRAIENSGFGN